VVAAGKQPAIMADPFSCWRTSSAWRKAVPLAYDLLHREGHTHDTIIVRLKDVSARDLHRVSLRAAGAPA